MAAKKRKDTRCGYQISDGLINIEGKKFAFEQGDIDFYLEGGGKVSFAVSPKKNIGIQRQLGKVFRRASSAFAEIKDEWGSVRFMIHRMGYRIAESPDFAVFNISLQDLSIFSGKKRKAGWEKGYNESPHHS